MLSNEGIFYKLLFDGYDFLKTEVGQLLVPTFFQSNIENLTYTKLYDNAEDFIEYCSKYSTKYIDNMEKYHVGEYSIEQCSDPNNPWHDKPYILFNTKVLKSSNKKHNIKGLKFWVCPSYYKGKVDGIGFRIQNPELVNNAFKWLFMTGNNIIYGKESVRNEDCYVVEGFRDYVALKECGYNVIGLGSVKISEEQEKYLKNIKPILLLDNDNFGLKQSLSYKNKYRIATLVKTKEKDAWDSYQKYRKLEIVEIK